MEYDFINHPKHYTGHKIETKEYGEATYETIDYIHSLSKRMSEFLSADEIVDIAFAAKYMDGLRGSKPDGEKTPREKIAEDLQKISWYCNHAANTISKNDE